MCVCCFAYISESGSSVPIVENLKKDRREKESDQKTFHLGKMVAISLWSSFRAHLFFSVALLGTLRAGRVGEASEGVFISYC